MKRAISQGQAMRSILGRSRVIHFIVRLLIQRRSTRGAEDEVVEGGHAVGLRPHADGAGAADVLVVELDDALAIERDRNANAGELDPQRVPGASRHWGVDVLEGLTTAALGV